MLSILVLFTVGFFISFLGSVPPGIINLTVMQLGIQHKIRAAYHFIFGVVFIEFFYALAAIKFSEFIRGHDFLGEHLNLVAAVVLLSFGVSNFITGMKPKEKDERTRTLSPLLKGVLVSLLNPLAITFWLGITTYLLTANIISFSGRNYFSYLTGIVLGTVLLLVLVAVLSKKFQRLQGNRFVVYHLPGIVFFFMGLYSFMIWLDLS